LFGIVQAVEPLAEFVGTFDLPAHLLNISATQ
jgi:hypothetical protein